MKGSTRKKLYSLLIALVIAGPGSNARGDDSKRPGELTGCNPKLIDRLLEVMEQEIIPLTEASLNACAIKSGVGSSIVKIELWTYLKFDPLWMGIR